MSHSPDNHAPSRKRSKAGGIGCLAFLAAIIVIVIVAAITGSNDDHDSDKPATPANTAPATNLDDAGQLACDDFAHGYKAAQTRSARIDLANKVNKWAQQSGTKGIADNAVALARGSEASAGAWQIGADSFAKACLDAGWKA